jgi:hypothetical protein
MQFVQFFQVKDCRCLQEIEIIFAGITKIGDVAKEGGTPVIVLTDTAVEQQVVPPSERARAGGKRTWRLRNLTSEIDP